MNGKQRMTPGRLVLWAFSILGVILIVYRFAMGLGAVTNLTDGYPWGFWIGVDILAGIALASGGFVLAGLVHLFGGKRFHALTRPAILTAFLGYLLFIFGLAVDLGRPWNIWTPMIFWNHASPMFEVGWCVMLYTTVLFMEFLPSVFERWKLDRVHHLWREIVPWIIIAMLGLFTQAMTFNVYWTLVVVLILLTWEILMRVDIMPRDQQMPILLIMAGIIFSTMHQSSLGSLFLLAMQKLHPLWYSPILPVLFFLSAVMVAIPMVIIESGFSSRLLGKGDHFDSLSTVSKAMPYFLGLYLFIKLGDVFLRGVGLSALELNAQSISWWIEMLVGVVLPLSLFMTAYVRENRLWLQFASWLVVLGLILNRLNVSVVGINVPVWENYYPMWSEVAITIGIISIGLLVFRWASMNLPIYGEEGGHA